MGKTVGCTHRNVVAVAVLAVSVMAGTSCQNKVAGPDPLSVAVFVPGVVSGSPTYEMLVEGAREAVAGKEGATLTVIEAGYDQSAWLDRLRDTVASGRFGTVVSSNPSLPELCATLSADYPSVRFLIADAYFQGHPAIHTVLYNQKEQGYIVGYLAGVLIKERLEGRTGGTADGGTSGLKAGMVIAQRYPTLDRLILPGFEAGLKAVDQSFILETREIGNWYDSAKAAELARSLFAGGAHVVLPIAGAAGQGVVSAAVEAGGKVVWFDGAGYQLDPDAVIGCATIAQDRLVRERLEMILSGNTGLFGKADIVGASQGYVGFDDSGSGYRNLPETVRAAFARALVNLEKGSPDLSFDSF